MTLERNGKTEVGIKNVIKKNVKYVIVIVI